MNNARRKWLKDVISSLEYARDELDFLAEEEERAYDNLPDNIQDSEKGNIMYENVDVLQTAASDIADILDSITEIV